MKTKLPYLLITLFSLVTIQLKASVAVKYYCPPCNNACDDIAYTAPGKCTHCGMTLVAQTEAEHQKVIDEKNKKHTKVAFYLQDGVEVLDFAGPLEVFVDAGFDVCTVSKNKGPIISQGVLKVMPDYTIDNVPATDIIVFFGGNSGAPSQDTTVINWLKKQTPQYYMSVCTGAFVLGKAGLLNGLTVTTFHDSIDDLKKAVPSAKVLSNARFVDNGTVITTAGISAGIDGALHLVAKLRGESLAKQVAQYMEYDKWVPQQGVIIKK